MPKPTYNITASAKLDTDAELVELLMRIGGSWLGHLDKLRLWSRENRDAVLNMNNTTYGRRQKGHTFLRIAVLNTPDDDEVRVIIAPEELICEGMPPMAWPAHQVFITPFPNTLGNLHFYLHECGHVQNDFREDNFAQNYRLHPSISWATEIEAEYFVVKAIARSQIHWLNQAEVERTSRAYMVKKLAESSESATSEARKLLSRSVLDFIDGKSLVFGWPENHKAI